VEELAEGRAHPPELELAQNAPNPLRERTSISFALPRHGPVDLAVYDITGQGIRTLLKGERQAGFGTVQWDGKNEKGLPVPPGVYLYRLKAGTEVRTKKMVLTR